MHLHITNLIARPAFCLGPVHSRIRIPDNIFRALIIAIPHGDPN